MIIDSIASAAHVSRYIELKDEFKDPNAAYDPDFQRNFRSYWQMNMARLPNAWYDGFFNLLYETRHNPTDDILVIINSLALPLQGQRTFKAFSFASKLLHTINNNLPIYDRNVKEFFLLSDFRNSKEIADHFKFLRNEYARVLKENVLQLSILAFREKFQLNDDNISDIKVIDSLIWKYINIMRTTPPLERIIYFD